MTVSIIIAVRTWAGHLEECVAKCLELDYRDFEIIILPDYQGTVTDPANSQNLKGTVPLKIIPTGVVTPAKKRDIAMTHAQGEIFAFIDDDAYPEKNWLKNAIKNFQDPDVAAVGGPAVTAQDDSLKQKASGRIYTSFLVSGNYVYRYFPKNKILVDDYPSCNFLVRKSIMQELGGFKTDFWPGEDTKLCLDITKKLKKKIIYDPQVLVYHHRRPVFLPHLKQVASYALHRGYFVKRYPATSLKVTYFIPSLLLFALSVGIGLSLAFSTFKTIYLTGLFIYLSLVFIFSISKDLRLIPLVFFGIILSHLTYGFWFLKGLLSKRLKEER